MANTAFARNTKILSDLADVSSCTESAVLSCIVCCSFSFSLFQTSVAGFLVHLIRMFMQLSTGTIRCECSCIINGNGDCLNIYFSAHAHDPYC